MSRSKELIASEFSTRRVAAMKARGHVSGTANSGVDVTALAKAAQTTYEMARRYLEGRAIPRVDKLQRISDWLCTQPSQLLYGEPAAAKSRVIHTEILQSCFEAAKRAEQLSE